MPPSKAAATIMRLSLSTMADFGIAENLAKSVLRLSMQLIKKFGGDVQIGHQIISLCVQVIFAVKRILGEDVFEEEYGKEVADKITAMKRVKVTVKVTVAGNSNESTRNVYCVEEDGDWKVYER